MVVGMRHTSNATSTVMLTAPPEYAAIGLRVTTTIRKTIERLARRMFRAISLGVFCRDAPSTSRIILSTNVSPGREVIFTTMRSLSTRVPPVTALRSPPCSRMTGADSPVIADSSTEAMPRTISPSPGMISPAETTTKSPRVRSAEDTSSARSPAESSADPTR